MNQSEELRIIEEVAAAILEAAGARGLRGACHDHLGKGWIVYWPHLHLPAE